jgi:hypothetical protein
MKNKLLLLVLAVATIPAAAVRADLVDNLSVEIRLGRRAPPPPPAVVVMVPDNGPRDPGQWERRGRWFQRSQVYYYYPGGDVYYRSSDRVWFYQERGQWRSGRHLPETVRLDFNHSVTLTMFTSEPYRFHQQVAARYPSDYFGTRVRLRDERRDDRHEDRRDRNNRRDNDRDDRNSDRDGRDKDKGRDNRR